MPQRPSGDNFARHALAALSLITLGACSVLQPSAPSSTSVRSGSARTPGDAPPSDADIAAIVVAANNADIAYADQALAMSRDADIHRFATMTRTDHESMNRVAVAVVKKLRLNPADNDASGHLRDDAEERRARFRDLEGIAFDSAYIHNEIAYHRTLLGVIDESLVPSARSVELKRLLVDVRPAVAAHLNHAEMLALRKAARRH